MGSSLNIKVRDMTSAARSVERKKKENVTD
nr:MAG TPA: hypothetical protein [Caudoviricetes sp.]